MSIVSTQVILVCLTYFQSAKQLADLYPRNPSQASQVFAEVKPDQNPDDMVGRPVQHASANKQATGEARYVDDIPHIEGN